MEPNTSSRKHDTIVVHGDTVSAETLAWNPHPKFAGVSLRHLVTGKDTGSRMSLHHVRVDPGCSIGDHAHAGQVEVHDVLAGSGSCVLDVQMIPYWPGVAAVMPADRVHRVDAGATGLLLLATFSPPLV